MSNIDLMGAALREAYRERRAFSLRMRNGKWAAWAGRL